MREWQTNMKLDKFEVAVLKKVHYVINITKYSKYRGSNNLAEKEHMPKRRRNRAQQDVTTTTILGELLLHDNRI
jgi:hypothetical protein